MPQLPAIASTAGRRLLPESRVQVDGAGPAAFGSAIGAGLQEIGQAGREVGGAIADFQLAKAREAEQAAEFDRQTQLISFGSAETERLTEASRDLSGPALDFTKDYMAGFDQRSAEFLAKVPERYKPQWQAKLAALRTGVAGDALRTELGQRDAWSKDTLGTGLETLLNGAAQSPDKLAEWRTQGETLINSSLLSAQDKAEALTKWRANVTIAAATGDIQRDPEGAIVRLGGIDHTTALEAAGKIGGGANAPTTVPGQTAAFVNPMRGSPEQTLEPGGMFGASRDGGARRHAGVDIRRPEGTAIRSGAGGGRVTVSRSEKGGNIVTIDHGGGLVTAYMHLSRVDVKTGDIVTGDTVLGGVGATGDATGPHLHYEVRINGRNVDPTNLAGKPTPARPAAAPAPAAAAPAAKPAAAPAAPPLPADATFEQQFDAAFAPKSDIAGDAAPPIDPRYKDLPFSVRMQLIGGAQSEIDRRQQVEFAASEAAHDEWLNKFMTDLLDGKAGRSDIEAARSSGHLTDYNEIAGAMNVVEAREKDAQQKAAYAALIASTGGPLNPFDDNARKAVDAAAIEQGKALGADGKPIGVAQAAFNIWQKTGVLAKPGAVALRGGLVSTDPGQVAAAASIASNMIRRNPNAFAGVEGGNEIERAAALYTHYVDDLGIDAPEAARRVAASNAPEAKRQVDVQKPQIDALRGKLRKLDVGNMLSNAFGGWFSIDPEFTSQEQINAASQDYADLVIEHYEKYGDEGAAQAYAMSQMKKLYGVVGGRLMKYPPTRSYPPVRGSYDYIFDQARDDIKRVTGRAIDTDDIYLMPIASATAEAFRAGKPAPYSIHYIDRSSGQPVYRVIAGMAFTADPGAAQRAAGGAFAAEREASRRREEANARARRQAADHPRRGRDY